MVDNPIRKHEASTINESLTHLGNVIRSIRDKASHVAYRSSKLTRLLQDSLGGNSVTAVVVTMNSLSNHIVETSNSLHFGETVLQVVTQTKQIKTRVDYKTYYIKLQKEYKELEQKYNELVTSGGGGGAYQVANGQQRQSHANVDALNVGLLEDMTSELAVRDRDLTTLRNEVKELTTALEERELEHQTIMTEIERELHAKISLATELQTVVDEFTEGCAELSQDNSRLEDENKRLREENFSLGHQKAILETRLIAAMSGGRSEEDAAFVDRMEHMTRDLVDLVKKQNEVLHENEQLKLKLQSQAQTAAQQDHPPQHQQQQQPQAEQQAEGLSLQEGGDSGRSPASSALSTPVGSPAPSSLMGSLLNNLSSNFVFEEDDDEMTCMTDAGGSATQGDLNYFAADDEFDEEEEDEMRANEEMNDDNGAVVPHSRHDRTDISLPNKIQCTRCGFEISLVDDGAQSQPNEPPKLMGAKGFDKFWATSRDVIENARTDSSWPQVNDVGIKGKFAAEQHLVGRGTYVGGEGEGASKRRWFRVWVDRQTNEQRIECVQEGNPLYKIRDEDVGCTIAFEYVPVRKDGVVGPAVVAWSSVPVAPGPPSVSSIRIENWPKEKRSSMFLCGTILFPEYDFKGQEGQTLVKWEKSLEGHSFKEVARGRLGDNKLQTSADVVHHYIRITVLPQNKDGERGRPVMSKLVYINVDPRVDTQLKSFVVQGCVTFPANVIRTDQPDMPIVLVFESKKLRLFRQPDKADATRTLKKANLQFALPWQNMQIYTNAMHDNRFVLRTIEKKRVTKVLFAVESREQRDLIMLAFRAFFAMGKPNVARVVLGEERARDWKRGKWKGLPESTRQTTISTQLAKPLPVFEKYTSKHRPGSSNSFLHLIEEMYIEGELDKTDKADYKSLPFTID